MLNPEYGDITDVDSGTDLVMKYGKPPGGQFPLTKLTPKRSTSPVCADKTSEECAELLESIPNFEDPFERKTSAEVQAMLDGHLLGDDDAEAASTETVKYKSQSEGDSNSVSEAFEELLG